ncbi:MAG: endonuclease III [Planctomycetes bacterium]|nr:endonuclease III [Planctomycetota bacterium]
MKRSSGSITISGRYRKIIDALYATYPNARCALEHSSALELLVATILSAQCTDARVNIVTKELFRRYPSVEAYAKADLADLEGMIRSTGFFHNKARAIHGACRMILERFGGRVPDTMEELLELPGVARKTANVVLGTWFKKATGIVVDTHVQRVAQRLELTQEEDAGKIERELMTLVDRKDWIQFSHRMIWHGRRICTARAPKCAECPLNRWCPCAGKV